MNPKYIQLVTQYWREALIASLLVAGIFGYRSFKREQEARVLSEANVAQAKIDLTTFKSGVVQANNELMKTQAELLQGFSATMRKEILDQKMKVLAEVNGAIKAEFDARQGSGLWDAPDHLRYSDNLMSYIGVNIKDPKSPQFDYKIAPFAINLEGALNFRETDGTVSFWVLPQVTGAPAGIHVSIPQMNFTPSPEFIQWETALKGKTVYIPVMPKYTISALAGREWAKEFPNGIRTVYGAELTRNFTNGLGIGGGFLGSTIYIKGGFSFGK